MIVAQLLPSPVYYLVALVMGVAAAIATNRFKSKRQSVVIGLIVAYLTLVLSSTILMRKTTEHYYELMLFWSYIEIYNGNKAFIYEIALNVLMLMPVGILLGIGFDIRKKHVVITGVMISLTIEVLQLVTRRGLFEFDDMLHNSLGCLIGYVVCKKITKLWKKLQSD